jgi:histidinol dehydrogenase
MKIYNRQNMNERDLSRLFRRSALDTTSILEQVKPILSDVKLNGDKAVIRYAKKFDHFHGSSFSLTKAEIKTAEKNLDKQTRDALDIAALNIERFHREQLPLPYSVETMPGITCWREFLPIDNIGLYIPGGSAVLVSTMLMLGIPAKLAGCERVIVSSPVYGNAVHPALVYAAGICGIREFYKAGGAHAIAMMAYGTRGIKKVDKIFGPGNQYVTAAKTLVSTDPDGSVIDMPAGPSEVLIIADKSARPDFVASDLLAQAEHGFDSQVILLTPNQEFAGRVANEIKLQIRFLPRKALAEKSLEHSFILIVQTISEAISLSNDYAPEHLILNFPNAEKILGKIRNAGSVFIGPYSPESAGDYASGTNHSLPTYGYAKSLGGVSVESFMKPITFQKLTYEGLRNIEKTIVQLAETEKLEAHANSVRIRLKNGNK